MKVKRGKRGAIADWSVRQDVLVWYVDRYLKATAEAARLAEGSCLAGIPCQSLARTFRTPLACPCFQGASPKCRGLARMGSSRVERDSLVTGRSTV